MPTPKGEPSTLDRLRGLARKVVKVPKEEVAELDRKRRARKVHRQASR